MKLRLVLTRTGKYGGEAIRGHRATGHAQLCPLTSLLRHIELRDFDQGVTGDRVFFRLEKEGRPRMKGELGLARKSRQGYC